MTDSIAHDLMVHMSSRLGQALRDFHDRCDCAEVNKDRAIATAMTVLGFYLSAEADSVDATEEEYLHMARWHYRRMKEQPSDERRRSATGISQALGRR